MGALETFCQDLLVGQALTMCRRPDGIHTLLMGAVEAMYCLAVHRSVPSGRVGNAKDAIFRSNEHFREAVAEREGLDVQACPLPSFMHTRMHA